MDMTGERQIAAKREAVWAALNDPEVLKACIPGCETLEKTSDNQMTATAAVKLGPVAARFSGKLNMSDLDPPNGYKLSGEGQGGPAGAAKGGAEVKLADKDGGTLLTYTMMAQVLTKGFRADILRRTMCFALFWHALDIIWVAVFTIVYLMGVL